MDEPLDSTPLAPPAEMKDAREIAPIWHTIVFLAVLFAFSIPGAKTASHEHARRTHALLYLSTMVMEWLYVGYIAWGVRLRGRKLRDIVGGRWQSFEAVVTDIVLGACFFFLNLVLRAIVLIPLFALKGNLKNQAEETQKVLQGIGPRTMGELLLFLGLALTAGICEEIMFRGYLQQQVAAWTGSASAAVILSTLVFGASHLYQGWFGMAVVTSYGFTLALLAVWRRSLRPGMIAHTWQDIIAGLLTHALSKTR